MYNRDFQKKLALMKAEYESKVTEFIINEAIEGWYKSNKPPQWSKIENFVVHSLEAADFEYKAGHVFQIVKDNILNIMKDDQE